METIKDIGPILAYNIVAYFNESNNKEIINKLMEYGINQTYKGEELKNNELISGRKFVVTGTISFMGRDEIERIIDSYGGHASSSVSAKTNVVIVGDNPGSKAAKAKDLGIEIWDEEKLYSIFNDLGEI